MRSRDLVGAFLLAGSAMYDLVRAQEERRKPR